MVPDVSPTASGSVACHRRIGQAFDFASGVRRRALALATRKTSRPLTPRVKPEGSGTAVATNCASPVTRSSVPLWTIATSKGDWLLDLAEDRRIELVELAGFVTDDCAAKASSMIPLRMTVVAGLTRALNVAAPPPEAAVDRTCVPPTVTTAS